MAGLLEAIARVCTTLDTYGIKRDGRPSSRRAIREIAEVLPISEELRALYGTALRSEVGFGWFAEKVTLYALSDLFERQYGYRWAVGSRTPLPGWNVNWIVIGDVMGGDPIIAATQEPGTPIYWAMHGVGPWKPVLAAASLAVAADALTEWLHVFHGEFQGKICDADSVPRPEAVEAIRSRVGKVVGSALGPWLPS
jgi:hypothetical protein